MYRIRIFSSFCPSENCKDVYERLCESALMSNYGPDKKIYITNGEDYTHVIILNTAMPQIGHIPKKNVIGFAFEPPQFLGLTQQFLNYAQQFIGKYFIGEKKGLPSPFIERFSHMWHNPPLPLNYIPEKTKGISMMISEKKDQPGHKHRHDLVKKILESGLPVDIYGRGCIYYEHLNDPRIKGKFTEKEPYEQYDFHIAIENFETNHYFSEKITNSLLCQTTPIYLGCRSIDEYFPDMVVQLSGDVNTDWFTLFKIVSNPEEYKKEIDVEKVKNKVSMLRNLDLLFS
jgi:hypothetical protein